MKRCQRSAIGALLVLALWLPSAAEAETPPPDLKLTVPSSIESGGRGVAEAYFMNNTDQPLKGPITITESVSSGAALQAAEFFDSPYASEFSQYGRITGQSCESSESVLKCVLQVAEPGLRGGVVVGNANTDRQKVTIQPGTEGAVTFTVRVESANAPPAEESRAITIGPPLPFDYGYSVTMRDPMRTPFRAAGRTPDSLVTHLEPTTVSRPVLPPIDSLWAIGPTQQPKDLIGHLPPGFIGNPQAIPTCSFADLAHWLANTPSCPADTQVGLVEGQLNGKIFVAGLFNMEPPAGAPARLGFAVYGVPVLLAAHLDPVDQSITLSTFNTTTTVPLSGVTLEAWGVPGAASHDGLRGQCLNTGSAIGGNGAECPVSGIRKAFIRTPTRCDAPLSFSLEGNTYQQPEVFHRKSFQLPAGTGCDRLPFQPSIDLRPTTAEAETASGLEVKVDVPNTGLENPTGYSESDVRKVVVALPRGITVNPSQAEGLNACTEAQFEASELGVTPGGGQGCPEDSKIGSVLIHTPLLQEAVPGSVYVAEPYENRFGTTLAIYVVLEEPQRGILVKLPGRVDLDPATGQITATFADLPQLPFSSFDFHFREGARAPLVTPPGCGTYTTKAEFTPWSDASKTRTLESTFAITKGVGGGACPSKGVPPFHPSLLAGTLNNRAGAFSPFSVRLSRSDGEQEFTNFSIKLPPGLVAKLAGLGYCSDAGIAAAEAREGVAHGGREEIEHPSCPAGSEVGHTLVGAGVGSVQAYVPGKLYYAGPYHGSPISLVSITAAKVGPFDLGTVVTRFAIRINPETAEVFVDARGSDPLPHIVDGITTHLRDIRAYVDRPEFTLNPTSCDRTSIAATVLGSGLDLATPADDLPVTASSPFQAASCGALPFHPKTTLRLRGATHRAGHPALTVKVVEPKLWTANAAWAQTVLPHSEFLENAHIGTVCTRVQFKAGAVPGEACPPASIYGRVRAVTPLLDEELTGPVFLRSNPQHELPDLVAALHSKRVDIELAGRIDSVQGGRIRVTFETIPDAYVKLFVLKMFGGKKGLLVNSTDLCKGTHRALIRFRAHNGKTVVERPPLRGKCRSKRGQARQAEG